MLTSQQAFDRVVAHLRTQGRKAMKGDKCMYRAPDGTKCAAGCLIPDNLYDVRMENLIIEAVYKDYPQIREHLCEDISLLGSLQDIHDCNDVCSWEAKFQRLAERKGLIYNAVQ